MVSFQKQEKRWVFHQETERTCHDWFEENRNEVANLVLFIFTLPSELTPEPVALLLTGKLNSFT